MSRSTDRDDATDDDPFGYRDILQYANVPRPRGVVESKADPDESSSDEDVESAAPRRPTRASVAGGSRSRPGSAAASGASGGEPSVRGTTRPAGLTLEVGDGAAALVPRGAVAGGARRRRALDAHGNNLIRVHVHVMDTVVDVSCGDGPQPVLWLGQVAIARYDRTSSKGYMQLGVPTRVFKPETQEEVPLTETVRDRLRDGDHVIVETSIGGGPTMPRRDEERRELAGVRPDGASEVSDPPTAREV